MTNRASIVRSSTPRALNANARSLGRSFGSTAAAGPSASTMPARTAPSARRPCRGRSAAGFGADPGEIAFEAMLDGDREDLRKFVRVPGEDRGLNRRVTPAERLDRDRHLACSFDLPMPVIE